jgi:hypothetical protein
MTKAYIRSLLKNTLAQIDETSRYHDTYLDHILEAVINSVYYQVHAENPRALGQYTKRFSLQYLSTEWGGRYAYALTVKLVPLPDKRGGVRSILDDTDTDIYFIPVTDQELLLMTESQARSLTTTTPICAYYAVRPTIVEFAGLTATELYHPFTFDLLVAFTSLIDTDEVPLPYGKNVEIIKMALEILGIIPPKDLLDNNSDVK